MTIDKCYTGLLQRLTSEGIMVYTSARLVHCQSNSERVLLMYDLLKQKGNIPAIKTVQKSTDLSTKYRNYGNNSYSASSYYKAWQYYNLALLHAPAGSEDYILAVSNRSAVLVALKKYKECLNDINTVFNMKYPKRIKAKLLERKKICDKAEPEEDDDPKINELISMSSPTLEHIPSASTKLEIAYSPEMGRHVIAKEDINVGEVIVEEKPYFPILLLNQFLFCCQNCLSRTANLIPCDKCCYCLYCSEECKSAAWESYHSIECSLMPTLITHKFTKLELLALRIVIKARKDHKDWESLLETIEIAEANFNKENYGFTKIDDKWIYDSKYYTSIHCLATNFDKRSVSDLIQKAITAAVFYHYLKEHTDFLNDGLDNNNVLKCVAGLLLHHSMTCPTNMHNISTIVATSNNEYYGEESIASGGYAFLSLINHSCAPNVVRYSPLGSSICRLYALRPIKKGMQLFDNYGPHHAIEDKIHRNSQLTYQYKFKCECEACINNWPTYFFLPSPRTIPSSVKKEKQSLLDEDNMSCLQKGDKKCALDIYPKLCNIVSELEPYSPCVEVADCQESLKQCLTIFNGVLPHGSNETVEWE